MWIGLPRPCNFRITGDQTDPKPHQSVHRWHPHTFVWWQCHRILASVKTVKHLLSSNVDCSRSAFCSIIASICGKIVFVCGMLTVGRRNRMDKSLNMRAWLKVNHDSLVDMCMWTHWTVFQLLYAQRWTCIVDTLSAITTMCTGQTGNDFHEV